MGVRIKQNAHLPPAAVKPTEALGDRPVFDVNIPYADFVPELTIFKNTKFEVDESEKTFNAASAKISIQGRNIHPGYAKDKMINASLVAMEINAMLPVNERPEFTTGYDGYHLIHMEGSVENAIIQYIVRDHNRTKFETKKELLTSILCLINMRYGDTIATLEMKDQYFNMREMVEPHMHIVNTAIGQWRWPRCCQKLFPLGVVQMVRAFPTWVFPALTSLQAAITSTESLSTVRSNR